MKKFNKGKKLENPPLAFDVILRVLELMLIVGIGISLWVVRKGRKKK